MNSDGTAPMCASRGCDVFRSPIADGPAPAGWRCSRHQKPPSWLDDPLASFDQYPDARAYIVASDVFPRVQKALQERYGPNISDRHFRGTPVVPSANISPGSYMIARNDETLNAHAFATDPNASLFDLQRRVRADARNGAGEVAGLAERVAKLEARMEDLGKRIDAMADSVNVDVDAIEKRLDVLDQIRRNEYPFSDVMSDPASFRPLWPMLEKAMVAAAAAAPAPRDEVALAAFEREAAEWKRRHADTLGKRMAETERIATGKAVRWKVRLRRDGDTRLFRLRRWINAHPCTVSMASVAAVGGAALMVLLR